MITFKLEACGDTKEDVLMAIEEAMRVYETGCWTGENSNSTGRFDFETDGQNVESYAIKTDDNISEARFLSYDEAEEVRDIRSSSIIGLNLHGEEISTVADETKKLEALTELNRWVRSEDFIPPYMSAERVQNTLLYQTTGETP